MWHISIKLLKQKDGHIAHSHGVYDPLRDGDQVTRQFRIPNWPNSRKESLWKHPFFSEWMENFPRKPSWSWDFTLGPLLSALFCRAPRGQYTAPRSPRALLMESAQSWLFPFLYVYTWGNWNWVWRSLWPQGLIWNKNLRPKDFSCVLFFNVLLFF